MIVKKLLITTNGLINLVDEAIAYYTFINEPITDFLIEDFILRKIKEKGYSNFEIIKE